MILTSFQSFKLRQRALVVAGAGKVGGVCAAGDAGYGQLQRPAHSGKVGGKEGVSLPPQGRGDILLSRTQGGSAPGQYG